MNRMIKCDACPGAATAMRKRRRFSLRVFLLVVGLVGVLAFIVSAESPGDDEIQQEFGQGSKHAQCLIQSGRMVARIHGTNVRPVHCVIVLQSWSSFCCCAVGRAPTSNMKVGIVVFHSPLGDRSPPKKAS